MKYYSEESVRQIIKAVAHTALECSDNYADEHLRNQPSVDIGWHTGTPTEENCFYVLQCKGRIHPEPYFGVVVNGKFSAINDDGDLMPLPSDLVAWQKIEIYKETK